VFFAVAMAACVAALLAAEYRASRVGVWLAKPAAAACFVAAGLSWGALDSDYGRVVLAGLALSLCGDVLLIPHGRPRVFQVGVAAFGLAHVAYLAAFALRFESFALAALAATVAALALFAVLPWLRPHLPDDMKGPVRAYMIVISLMLIAAAGASPADPRILVGAAMFYVSDLSVARGRFVAPGFANGAWGLPLYFGAQLVIASTVALASLQK
jgi:uncharacterized membrane protein YhhN